MAPPSRRLPSQKPMLQRQVDRLRATIDRGDPYYEAMTLEWHALHYGNAFATVRDQCEDIHLFIGNRDDFATRSWQYRLPLWFAVNPHIDLIDTLPDYAVAALNDTDSIKRLRARMAVYWAAPLIRAGTLYAPCLEAVRTGREPREMAFIIALCPGALDTLWRLREQLPGYDNWLGELIGQVARGAVVWNPMAQEVARLTQYMFFQSMGMREEDAYFRRMHVELSDESLRPGLTGDAAALMGAHTNFATVEATCHWLAHYGEKRDVVRCPLLIDRTWYRLMRAEDGRCWVERREKDDRWSVDAKMPLGTFIAELRRTKGL